MIYAAREGHLEAVKLLIENGSIVTQQNVNKRTALIEVAKKGQLDIVNLLLKEGADVNHIDLKNISALIS